jgi:CRP-like cAMP-binding protein
MRPTNFILQSLSDPDYDRLRPFMTEVRLARGEVLHEPQEPGAIYFLTDGLADLTVSNDDGKELAISLVGTEGVVGEHVFSESSLQLIRCSMIVGGSAMRLPREVMKEEFDRAGELHDLVLRCAQARVAETAQTALCNQTHNANERVARLTLTIAHRLRAHEIAVTHEDLARMLALRRPGVTTALGELQTSGGLTLHRGRTLIADQAALESEACECFRVIQDAVDRVFQSPPGRTDGMAERVGSARRKPPREILILEDDFATMDSLRSALTANGYHVTARGSAVEALALLDEQKYEVVVLDLVLEDGNGVLVLERLRQTASGTPVVVVTQYLRSFVAEMMEFFPQVKLIVHKPASAAAIAASVTAIAAHPS